jgi:hypothetical protein
MNEKNRTYSSTFDNTTMYDLGEKININLVNDKFNLNINDQNQYHTINQFQNHLKTNHFSSQQDKK